MPFLSNHSNTTLPSHRRSLHLASTIQKLSPLQILFGLPNAFKKPLNLILEKTRPLASWQKALQKIGSGTLLKW